MKAAMGRLALRREGKWWVGYHARHMDRMTDAVELARIRINLAEREPVIKQAFMDLCKLVMSRAIEDVLGTTPDWQEPVPGPESERSGHG